MKKIPLSLLFFEGPIGRAYLAHVRAAGFRFERILVMVGTQHPTTGKTIGRWMPRAFRHAYAERLQESAYNHWPRRIAHEHPSLVSQWAEASRVMCPGAPQILSEIRAPLDFTHYSDQVERISVTGVSDPTLEARLSTLGRTTVVYSGGGIVPRTLLGLPKLRFLHVHPGYLPYVRGADGVLWSTLVRGTVGASCFFMAPDIDTGELLARQEYPPVILPLANENRPSSQTLYRAVFAFFDPLVRSTLLVKLLEETAGRIDQVDAQAQDLSIGTTFHFMHDRVREAALAKLFYAPTGEGA